MDGMNRRYDFLDKTLNALVVDDEWISQALVSELLSHVNIFEISTASRCAEAVTVLRSRRIHLCILDLGINDIDNDEFYLLRTYAKTCSIIVLTASTSPQKGGLCMELGARAILEKRAPFDNRTFIINSNRYALLNIINPYYRERAGDTLGLTTKVLFEKDPRSVTEWADCLRITDRQLRNLWNSGTGAKSILFL